MERLKISIKFIIGILLSISFFLAIVFWACSNNTPAYCKSTGQGSWSYDNQTPITDSSSLVYLKMFNLDNLSCANNSQVNQAADRVKEIQWSMKTNCNFDCEDGFFWNDTRTALTNCANTYCTEKWANYSVPTLQWENLACEDGYTLDSSTKCCKNTCDNPPTGWQCESGYVLNWACCAACDNPPTAWQCGSGYVLDWACCVMKCSVPTEERDCNRSWWDWNDSKCKCECNPNKWCCGVQLNVPLPFIGDCIEMTTNNSTAGSRTGSISVNQLNAFPVLVKWITKILVTLIMIFSIIVVIVAWLMMTTSVASEQNYKTWLKYLEKVLISLILLWTSWLILKLINPSFFGG